MSNSITVYGNTGELVITRATTQPAGGGLPTGNTSPGGGNQTGGGGTGNGPGGIGTGDGGFDTPSDPTINTPVITFPNAGNYTGIEEDDIATSSAFAASGMRTHAASRWMISFAGELGDDDAPNNNSPTVIYDSGVTATDLTALGLEDAQLKHESYYYIRVRYKASGGNWSNWSNDQLFITGECEADAPFFHIDIQDPESYLGAVFAAELYNLEGTQVFVGNGSVGTAPDRITTQNVAADVEEIWGYESMLGVLVPTEDYSVFLVANITLYPFAPYAANDSVLGFVDTDNPNPTTNLGAFNGFGLARTVAAPLNTLAFFTTTSGNSLSGSVAGTADPQIIEIVVEEGVAARLLVNGVEIDTSTGVSYGGLSFNQWGLVDTTEGLINNGSLNEVLIYAEAVSEEDAETVREALATKWGITL